MVWCLLISLHKRKDHGQTPQTIPQPRPWVSLRMHQVLQTEMASETNRARGWSTRAENALEFSFLFKVEQFMNWGKKILKKLSLNLEILQMLWWEEIHIEASLDMLVILVKYELSVKLTYTLDFTTPRSAKEATNKSLECGQCRLHTLMPWPLLTEVKLICVAIVFVNPI